MTRRHSPRSPALRHRLLTATLALGLAACAERDASRVHLTSSTSSDPYQRALAIRAQVTGSPTGLRYKWYSVAGETEPQDSDQPATVFTFADDATKDRVTLEVWRADKLVTRSEIDVTLDSAVALATNANPPKVVVTIDEVPPYDQNGGSDTRADIAGRVIGDDASAYRVVIYARADLWYRQPSPYAWVAVAPDGTWKTWTHTGVSYAVFAIRRDVGLSPRLDVLPRITGNIPGRVVVEGVRR
jgi:hypothetical protein